MASIHNVESFVWACFTCSWLALRLNISRSPLEEFTLIPHAILAVGALLARSTSDASGIVDKLLFQLGFGMWLTMIYATVEGLVTENFRKSVLENTTYAVASVSISLAFSTIQMLIEGAAVKDDPWYTHTWATATIVWVSTLHTCTKHDTQLSMTSLVITLWANICIIVLKFLQLSDFPLEFGVGVLSLRQILDILSVSFQVVTIVFVVVTSVISQRTLWLLPVFLCLPLAFQLYATVTSDDFRVVPSAPPQDPAEPENEFRQPNPTPVRHATMLRPNPIFDSVILPNRPPPYNPAAKAPGIAPVPVTDSLHSSAKTIRDALLFGQARPIVPKSKKNM